MVKFVELYKIKICGAEVFLFLSEFVLIDNYIFVNIYVYIDDDDEDDEEENAKADLIRTVAEKSNVVTFVCKYS